MMTARYSINLAENDRLIDNKSPLIAQMLIEEKKENFLWAL